MDERLSPMKIMRAAYVIPFWRNPQDEIYVMMGQSVVINFLALVEFKQKYGKRLKFLISEISSDKCSFDDECKLIGGDIRPRLGRGLRGVLMEGQVMFPGGKAKGEESFTDAAIRELCEEFYLKIEEVPGGREMVVNNLEELLPTSLPHGNKQSKFYMLDLNKIGLTPEGIIENFNKKMRDFLPSLSPKFVWEKYDNPKAVEDFPEMKEICSVPLDEIEKALNFIDTDFILKETEILADFLCNKSGVNTSIRTKFKEKILNCMGMRKPNIGQVEAGRKLKGFFDQKEIIHKSSIALAPESAKAISRFGLITSPPSEMESKNPEDQLELTALADLRPGLGGAS